MSSQRIDWAAVKRKLHSWIFPRREDYAWLLDEPKAAGRMTAALMLGIFLLAQFCPMMYICNIGLLLIFSSLVASYSLTDRELGRIFWFGSFKWYVISILLSIFCFAFIYRDYGVLVDGQGKKVDSFGAHLYFSCITWTTLGYGDIQPVDIGRLVAGIEAMTGYVFMAFLVAILFARLTNQGGRLPCQVDDNG